MKLIVSNECEVINPSDKIVAWIRERLVFPNPEYETKAKLGLWLGSTPKELSMYKLMNSNKNSLTYLIPFGCWKDVWEIARSEGIECEVVSKFIPTQNYIKGAIKLWGYQEKACRALFSARNGCLKAPCGSGKTQIGLELARRLGVRTLWIAGQTQLIKDASERALSLFDDVGVGFISEGKVELGRDITFATMQTLSKVDLATLRNCFGCIIVDEAHHLVGTPTKLTMLYKIVNGISARYKYGLSATYDRADGLIECVFRLLGGLVYSVSDEDVKGYKVERVEVHKVYLSDVSKGCEDSDEYLKEDGTFDYLKYIQYLSACEWRNREIVHNVMEYGTMKVKQLVLCKLNSQVMAVASILKAWGVRVKVIIGATKKKERDFSFNEYDVLISNFSLAKEGLDIPVCSVLHLASPMKDKTSIEQACGRVERKYLGKQVAYILDYVDKSPYGWACEKKRNSIYKKKGYVVR